MALVNIILNEEEFSLDISDDIAILFLKRLGVFDNNLQYKSNTPKELNEIKSTKSKVEKSTKSKGTLQSKAEEYGLERLRREYENGEKSLKEFLDIFGVKEATFRCFLSNNEIKRKSKNNKETKAVNKQSSKDRKQTDKKISANNVIVFKQGRKSSNRPVNVINAHVKTEMKHLEKTVKVESGTCLRCGYKDKIDGACDYSLITFKDRRGNKGMCNHFIDLEDLNDKY